MMVHCRPSNRGKLGALLAVTLVVLLGLGVSAALAATPAAFFNQAGVIGLSNMITTSHVPIQTSTGAIIFKDVTIQINVDAAGNLTYATTAPIATLSPTLSSSNIIAGTYTNSLSASLGILVSGPAPIGSGGEAQWSIAPAAGLGCTYPSPATFYTGPSLAIANSTLAARVKAAAITATQYAFGIVDEPACRDDGNFHVGALIGVTTVGNQLMVSSFTPNSGVDQKAPVETVIFNFLK